ncbi:MAG: hypothetical protein JWL87_493 [Candidatus Adlerbacteria bacterium]|nr:hypothetical protein [Candidatus Adlerbacteria bacterium]
MKLSFYIVSFFIFVSTFLVSAHTAFAAFAYLKLYDFSSLTGTDPYDFLIEKDGIIYGVGYAGGANSKGVIYSYDPAGSGTYTVLYNFNGTEGGNPSGTLFEYNGIFYGVTDGGGTNNKGVLYSIDPADSSTFTVLHSFDDTHGAIPQGALLEKDGVLYGTTLSGGPDSRGVIYSYNPAGSGTFTVLHNFNGTEGGGPYYGSMILSDGVFYGEGTGGLSNQGTIFSYDPAGSGTYTVLHNFNGTEGNGVGGNSLVAYGGKFYGMTGAGGTNNKGVIFSYDPAGSGTYTVLYNFDTAEGYSSQGSLLEIGGVFYGITFSGGTNSKGVVFSFDPADSGTYTVLHNFDGTDGKNADATLFRSSSDVIYGVTEFGGVNNNGVLFSLTSDQPLPPPTTLTVTPTATPTPEPHHRSSHGSSVQSRVKNLIAMSETQKAEDLMKNFPQVFQSGDVQPVSFTRDLKTGFSGDDVKALQEFLNGHESPVALSGIGSAGNETDFFGALTRAALAKFQKTNGITPSLGYFGPKTKAFIASIK